MQRPAKDVHLIGHQSFTGASTRDSSAHYAAKRVFNHYIDKYVSLEYFLSEDAHDRDIIVFPMTSRKTHPLMTTARYRGLLGGN